MKMELIYYYILIYILIINIEIFYRLMNKIHFAQSYTLHLTIHTSLYSLISHYTYHTSSHLKLMEIDIRFHIYK